jgi:hypothetical protein
VAKTKVVKFPFRSGTPELEIVDGRVEVRGKDALWLLAKSSERQFRATKNPVYAIESFRRAQLAGKTPPKKILAWIGECFQAWHEAEGKSKQSLDSIMGLTPGRGGTPAYKAALLAERDTMLFCDIARLIRLGATMEQAAHMVFRKLENSGRWNKTRWRLALPNEDSILQGYKRWPEKRKTERFYMKHFPEWTVRSESKYLSTFPPDSLAPCRARVPRSNQGMGRSSCALDVRPLCGIAKKPCGQWDRPSAVSLASWSHGSTSGLHLAAQFLRARAL